MQNVKNAHRTSRWRVGHVRLFKLISEENSRLQRMERTPWMALGSGTVSHVLSEMHGSSLEKKNFSTDPPGTDALVGTLLARRRTFCENCLLPLVKEEKYGIALVGLLLLPDRLR